MIRAEFRWVVLGAVLGLTAALVPSCAKKCGPSTCKGCCSSKGECLAGGDQGTCGGGGAACAACSDTQSCAEGVCAPLSSLVDAGPVDAGPPTCQIDDDCAFLHTGSVCDTRAGLCVDGRGCREDNQCQLDDPNDPCYRYGTQCRCDHADAPDSGTASYSGTCRRRKGPCQECTVDAECGADVFIFGPPEGLGAGKCKLLQGDTSNKKHCLYQRVGMCPCGTVDDGDGYCRPQSNSCDQVGCNLDKDCPSGSVCTARNMPDGGATCGGLCVPRCRWDFVKREAVAPGCPQGQTCWVDSENLDPTSLYYGSGRCKVACENDGDCHASSANPFGGANLKCAGEKLMDNTLTPKRCRANGECMDNEECPALPDTQPNMGYCDRGQFACKTDCRTGNDPISGVPFKDCRSPYACAADGGANICRLMSCVEQGGAGIACPRAHYCCGDDKDNDGKADPCPPKTQQDSAGCYLAPTPPFCTKCTDDTTCRTLAPPPYLTGANACSNGSLSPSCSPLGMKCEKINQNTSICAPATWNDNTLVGFQRRSSLGCPAGYQVTPERPTVGNSSEDYCSSDADCNQGTDAGRCDQDMASRLQDGGYRKACLCTAGSGKAQCPNNSTTPLYSECYSATAGATTFCVESVVCLPPPGVASLDAGAPKWGCGIQ